VATSDAAFRGGACPTPEYTIAYTGNYTTSADANSLLGEPPVLSSHMRRSAKHRPKLFGALYVGIFSNPMISC